MMNYIEFVNQFWAKDVEYHFSDKEAALYFYLLNVCNSGKWRNPFRLSNNVAMARFGWGKASFDRARNKLKEAGLIHYRQGLGRGNISQYILKEGYFNEFDLMEGNFEAYFSNGQEKDTQINLFSGPVSDFDHTKGSQTNAFFSDNNEKEAQAGIFFEAFENAKTPETEAIQTFETIEKQQIEKSLFEHNNIFNTINILDHNKLDIENKDSISCGNSEKRENEVVALFRRLCRSFPQIMRLTKQRKEKILRRLSEMGGIKIVEKVFCKMEASDFLKGNNKYGWQATFDWVFKNSENWMKILEGNYDNRIVKPQFIQPANVTDGRFMGMLQTDLSKF